MAPRHCFKALSEAFGSGTVCRQVLCPEPLASSVLGTRGSTKDRIQERQGLCIYGSVVEEECNCRLVMSNRAMS